jgi:hypothetical protein
VPKNGAVKKRYHLDFKAIFYTSKKAFDYENNNSITYLNKTVLSITCPAYPSNITNRSGKNLRFQEFTKKVHKN